MEGLAVFNSLLTKNHVISALMQDEDRQNEVPLSLTTVLLMAGSPAQLKAVYEHKVTSLKPWAISPGRITAMEDQQRHLGDPRYQRAYMDYFSMRHGHFKGNFKALLGTELTCGPSPLMYGLFGGFGQAMITLGDSMEARNPILIVQSLVWASIDYSNDIYAILSDPRFDQPHTAPLSPETILRNIAYDGRFSIKLPGPGFHHAPAVLSNSPARSAILGYIHQLDMTNVEKLLQQMSQTSVFMLCAAHKMDLPAFDMYLSRPISLVQGLRVLLRECLNEELKKTLIRGTWLLIVLVYITQLRPYLDKSLVFSFPLPEGRPLWDHLFQPFHGQPDGLVGKYLDTHFLRALRSLHALSLTDELNGLLYLKAAWKLDSQWSGWAGLGNTKETSLNIRL
ncbi:hypothetical protein VMCG_09387 [Cytospora schulzeri]|uniref:Uncharacterized protein n=1 Tax=Cytospora schulzeri TaxID=448051 RepID=A0A423VIG6_9PEZI|nr:hypothetical protein VMCG_09387 [Valsa malicola]